MKSIVLGNSIRNLSKELFEVTIEPVFLVSCNHKKSDLNSDFSFTIARKIKKDPSYICESIIRELKKDLELDAWNEQGYLHVKGVTIPLNIGIPDEYNIEYKFIIYSESLKAKIQKLRLTSFAYIHSKLLDNLGVRTNSENIKLSIRELNFDNIMEESLLEKRDEHIKNVIWLPHDKLSSRMSLYSENTFLIRAPAHDYLSNLEDIEESKLKELLKEHFYNTTLYLTSELSGDAVDLFVPRAEEAANSGWYKNFTLRRLDRFAGDTRFQQIDFEGEYREEKKNIFGLPSAAFKSAITGDITEYSTQLRKALHTLNKMINNVSFRGKVTLEEKEIFASAKTVLSSTI